MSRSQKNTEVNASPKFNVKPYLRTGLTESDILEIKDHFDIFDREHIGSINPKEIKSAISSLGLEARAHGVYQVILDMDSEGAGNITFEQFIHLMTPRLIPEDSRENIDSIFTLFDDEKTGFISLASLRRAVHELGMDLYQQDLEEMIKRADEDQDGFVSRDEFFNLLSSFSV